MLQLHKPTPFSYKMTVLIHIITVNTLILSLIFKAVYQNNTISEYTKPKGYIYIIHIISIILPSLSKSALDWKWPAKWNNDIGGKMEQTRWGITDQPCWQHSGVWWAAWSAVSPVCRGRSSLLPSRPESLAVQTVWWSECCLTQENTTIKITFFFSFQSKQCWLCDGPSDAWTQENATIKCSFNPTSADCVAIWVLPKHRKLPQSKMNV